MKWLLPLGWLFVVVSGLEEIYFLRHCDKPLMGPCCSREGYQRIALWKTFLETYPPLAIHTVGSRTAPDKCAHGFGYPRRHHCPHSQRMLITSQLLSGLPQVEIEGVYCTGGLSAVVDQILHANRSTNALIVWQHTEMLDVLKRLGCPLYTFGYDRLVAYHVVKEECMVHKLSSTVTLVEEGEPSYALPYMALLVVVAVCIKIALRAWIESINGSGYQSIP